MTRHQEILFGVSGQSFYLEPPEGRATGTPTLSVYFSSDVDEANVRPATTGTCSIDSTSTTLSALATAGTKTISVSSATGIQRLRSYRLTNADGNYESIEVMGINGTTITLRSPLINDFAIASTFQGTRISIGVDPTWVADRNNIRDQIGTFAGYRLRWTYVVGGTTYVQATFADLVRYSGKNLVVPHDVNAMFSDWIDRLPTDYREDQGRAIIEAAYQSVRMDALGDGQALRRIRDTDVLRELVCCKANWQLAFNQLQMGGGSPEALKAADDLYAKRFGQLMQEPKYDSDQGGGGAGDQSVRLPLLVR